MDLSTALSDAVSTYRRRPADLLPFYVLGAAVPVIARVVSVAGLAVAYAYLELTGNLAAFRDALAGSGLSPPDPEADPDAFQGWALELESVVGQLFDPVVVVLLAGTALATVLVAIGAYAGASAGQYAVCLARLRAERGTLAGIAGVRAHWLSLLGLYVLEAAIWAAASVAAVVAVAVIAADSPVLGGLAALGAFLAWAVVVLGTRAIFAFAPVAVVVDDVGVAGGVKRAFGFVRANPGEAVGYYAIAVVSLFALSTAGGALSVVGVGGPVTLAVLFAIAPGLDLVKTGLFGGWRGVTDPEPTSESRLRDETADGLRRAWVEMTRFVRANPGLHVVAAVLGIVGFAFGWLAADPFMGSLETSIAARLAGHVPPAAAMEFFTNNWLVAFGMAFGGVALAAPAAVSLWFNGFVFGLYFRLETEMVELLAFVIPHGIVELPALFVAGAVGLRLGGSGWRTWRGRASRRDLADDLERAFRVLVGVGILLFVAGVIEGFVSPYYFRPFL